MTDRPWTPDMQRAWALAYYGHESACAYGRDLITAIPENPPPPHNEIIYLSLLSACHPELAHDYIAAIRRDMIEWKERVAAAGDTSPTAQRANTARLLALLSGDTKP